MAAQRVILGATLERDLELARQPVGKRMAEEIARHRLGVRRDIEDLGVLHARVRAGGDVADRVAARLARGEPGRGEVAHHRFGVLQQDEVELDVLPRRDVAEPARVLRAGVGEGAHLRAGHDPLRNLDPHHLDVVLPLAVGAAHQAELPPRFGGQLAALVLFELVDELVDVALVRERQARTPERRVIDCGHTSPHSRHRTDAQRPHSAHVEPQPPRR